MKGLMFTREVLITRINASLAWLESYLKLNAAGNLNTSSVLAEDFCIRLLNLVYGHNLKNANAEQLNTPAVDLVLAGNVAGPRVAYQVTIDDTSRKITDTHERLAGNPEVAARFDEVIIFFLVRKAPKFPTAPTKAKGPKAPKAKVPKAKVPNRSKPSRSFTPCTSPSVRTLDLTGLLNDIRALPLVRIRMIADALNKEFVPPPKFLRFVASSWTDTSKALACLAAVILAWMIPPLLGVQLGSSTSLVVIGIATVPLVCYLFLDARPRWREARYRARAPVARDADETYFKTWPRPAPGDDQPVTFSRPDKAERTVLEWIERAASPMLHLTGASGTGKSSLLDAFVIPHLRRRDPAWHVIKLRSFDDPLTALSAALPGVWKNPSADLQESLIDRLIRALAYLQERNRRLLIVFDQFEELFILHPLPSGPVPDGSPPPLVQRVGELLTAVTVTAPIPGLTVLLSYRADHRSDIDTLRLPARNEDHEPATRTAFEVQPFTFAAAWAYLTGCPGLTIPSARLQQALEEAAAIDESGQRVRPIVLNLLGRALQDLAENPRRSSRRGSLLHDYIRSHAFDPREERLPKSILPHLLSNEGTIAPATAEDIAPFASKENKAPLTAADITRYLSRLRTPGIIRQIGTGTGPHSQWEIAHDFIARLIHLILGGTIRSLWRKVRPWLAPSILLVLILAGAPLFPAYRERESMRALDRAGFTWRADVRKAERVSPTGVNLGGAIQPLQLLKSKSLELGRCDTITSLDALKDLATLQNLALADCAALTSVDGLKGLTLLKRLKLSGCSGLASVDGLKGLKSLRHLELPGCRSLASFDVLESLTSLQRLDLSHCPALTNAEVLRGLAFLQHLDLSYCSGLTNIDVIKDLASLQRLDLSHCPALRSVEVLSGLTSLQRLDLSYCSALTSADVLKNLTSLQRLDLSYCSSLASIDALKNLRSLHSLDLSDCKACVGVEVLKGLTSLETLDLSSCDYLASLEGVEGLGLLQSLDLSHCGALLNIDGLKGHTSLQSLVVSHCAALSSVEGLKGLTSLKTLDLTDCDRLTNVDALKDLPSLQDVNLCDCAALTNVDGLSGHTSLHSLNLRGCDSLANVDALKGLHALRSLDLAYCEKLSSLESLEGLNSLKRLYLRGCSKVPREQITALRAALPDCEIESY